MTAIHDSRRRAKNASIAHTITLADIYMPEHCPVLGIKLEFGQPRGCSSSPSLDRFDMSLGYVPGNVRVISRRANTLKNDATAAELRAVAAYAEGEL